MTTIRKVYFILLMLCSMSAAAAPRFKIRTVVIPVQFADTLFTSEEGQYPAPLFSSVSVAENGTGSLRDWLRDNLGDISNISFDILPAVTLSKGMAYYGANTAYSRDAKISELITEACRLAREEGANFSRYDADNDGKIDNVIIFHAGCNEAESGRADDIWPQSHDFSYLRSYFDGKLLGNAIFASEYGSADHSRTTKIGTICHEYGHLLGLPDLYDVNGETEGSCAPLYGTVSLMDRGGYNNGGITPPYLNVVERELLGMLTVTDVLPGVRYELKPIQSSTTALRIPTATPGEYYLLEYRDGTHWDSHIGGKGLLIYHIDKSQNLAGSMTASMRWSVNAINGCAAHPCAMLFDARDSSLLTGLFYPGDAASFTIMSNINKPLLDWNESGVEIGLSNIHINDAGNLEFTATSDLGWNIPYATSCNVLASQHAVRLEWEATGGESDEWIVLWGPRYGFVLETAFAQGNSLALADLHAGEEYRCIIFSRNGILEGKRLEVNFKTLQELTSFPLIGGMKGSFNKGETINLIIYNLSGEPVSEQWYVNGIEVSGREYTFTTAGIYVIKVVYSQSGNETETIEKKVRVVD